MAKSSRQNWQIIEEPLAQEQQTVIDGQNSIPKISHSTREAPAQGQLNRRGILSQGLLGVTGLLVAACSSSTDFISSSRATGRHGGRTGTPGEPGDGLDGPNGQGGPGELKPCKANNTTSLDVDDSAEAEAKFQPTAMLYGRPESALLALQLKSDLIGKIKQVIVARSDGTLMALHGITPADIDEGSFHPIVIDNLILKDSEELKIILQTANERHVATVPVEFSTTSQG